MLEVQIPPSLVMLAQDKAAEMGALHNSIRKGQGNVVGFLGEFLVAGLLNVEVINTYHYDLIFKKIRIDVKTKECTSPPQLDYDCSIAAYNTTQECDAYSFVRILNDLKRGWILGFKTKEAYFQEARFCRSGEIDSKSTFGWRFKADCFNLAIKDLDFHL